MRAAKPFVALALLFGAVAVVSAQGRARPAGLTQQSWMVGGVERTALVAAPKAPAAPATSAQTPVVFVFHGHGGTSAQASRSFRIHEAWPEALVIYPQGLPTVGQLTDPQGRLPGWQHVPGGEGDRDLKFVDAMFEWVREKYGLDPARTFAAGHSNGGSMVYTLWAARGDRFAGLAPSSSVFRPDVSAKAKPKRVFIVAGREDALVRFPAQERSLQSVLRLNGADRTGERGPDGIARHASKSGADVYTYIHEGGHQLPADAGLKMVSFFKAIVR